METFNHCIWLGGHTWSLAYEEQFYLLFPTLLTLFLLRRLPFLPHLVFALAFCALPLFWPLSYAGRWDFYIIYGLFGAGFLAARYEAEWRAALAPVAGPGLLLTALLVLAAPVFMPWPMIYNNYPFVFMLALPVMVLCSGLTRLGGFLLGRPLRYLGRVSYGIYLWQELATSDLTRPQPLWVAVLAVIGIITLAAALFEIMERPLIRYGRRLSERFETSSRPAPAE